MIEIRDYKYKELCKLMNESAKSGKSKQLQLKNWKRFFEWTNPTSQIYRITKIYDIPLEKVDKRKNNGGTRAGAGAKAKLDDEFKIILCRFIQDEHNKCLYFNEFNWDEIYFNNDTIYKYFGLYRDIYEAKKTDEFDNPIDPNVKLIVLDIIMEKIREKARSLIFNKIDHLDSITRTVGIILKLGSEYIRRDDLLEAYNTAEEEFLESYGFRSVVNVAEQGMWNTMQKYINSRIKDEIEDDRTRQRFKSAKKYHKIKYGECNELPDYVSYEDYKKAQRSFNNVIVKEVYNFFLKTEKMNWGWSGEFIESDIMKDYVYILDTYVRLEEILTFIYPSFL